MEPLSEKRISVDGMLREWPAGFARLKAHGKASSNSAMIGYDDDFLYVAAKIKDAKIVRTKSGSKGEDHLSLSLYIPGYKGKASTHTIDIFPGQPGKLGAMVKVDGRVAKGADAVENPTDGGFFLEAKIPQSALAKLDRISVGLRGVLSYHDANAVGRISAVYQSGQGSGSSMPPLTTDAETGLIEALLIPKGLSLTPDREVYGDLSGKSGAEKVALYGHFLSIVGPEYKGGKEFYFNELDVESADQITDLSLRDFDGDQKDEIIIEKKLGNGEKYRKVLQVLKLGPDGAPIQIFGHETAIVTADGKIENQISVKGAGKSAKIVVAQGAVEGFDPKTYAEPTIGGAFESALLPWQSIKSRTFSWTGQSITKVSEESWEPKLKGPSRSSGGAFPSNSGDAPPPPRAPTADERLDRVYALYRQDRGVKTHGKPSFDFVTDVVEDEQMERVLVHDRDLVVFGKGFKQGLSYTFLTIGVKDAKDVLSVTARDIVGDGKAEIIVHAIINAQASKSLGGDVVGRQALFIYKVQGQTLQRIFSAETGRSLNDNRILSGVAFLPTEHGLEIELRPLRAIGWDEKSYPFPEDRHPAGGLEPLLLPWGSVGSQRYVYNGEQYIKK